jgi:ABC-2 type transport system permease protein
VSDARIHDRGYRAYEGERSGIPGAVRSVGWHAMRTVLGIGRPARHKIFPVVAAVIAFLPAVVFVGLAALFPVDLLEGVAPSYSDYLGYVGVALVLFCGLVAPEVLVRDRRDGMFALYLSTPLRRDTYLVAKVGAVMATLAIVTIGPPLLQLIAFTFEGAGPGGVTVWVSVFVRIVISGVAMSAVFAAVSLAAASLTDRRAFASVGIILVLLVSGALVDGLVNEAGMSENLQLLNLLIIPFELVYRIYGEAGNFPDLTTAAVVIANLGWITAGTSVIWLRYRRLSAG